MATTHYSPPNLLVVMDSLWFNQPFLFSEPNSLFIPKPIPATPQPLDIPSTTLLEEEISSGTSSISSNSSKDNLDYDEDKDSDNMMLPKSLIITGNRSHSSSPSLDNMMNTPKTRQSLMTSKRNSHASRTMSLIELEHEEVKGFMDLGFTFKKEELSPRMMSVIPGLQRLQEYQDEQVREFQRGHQNVTTPYLSQVWLVRKPDSPLLNLEIPTVLSSHEMKKHLRDWATTVATAVQVEY